MNAECVQSKRIVRNAGKRTPCRAAALVTACLISGAADADFLDEPYPLRIFLTLDRQSNYATTLGRQASVAYLEGSSINPAAGAWSNAPYPSTSVTATYVDIPSASGRRISAVPVTARWQLPDTASVYLAYAYTYTPTSTGNDGLDQSLTSNEFVGGYSRRVSDSVSVGASIRVVTGHLVYELFAPSAGGQPIRNKTELTGGDISFGADKVLAPGLTAGIALNVGWVPTRNVVSSVDALVVPTPGVGVVVLPAGTVLDRFDEIFRNWTVRTGLGFKPTSTLGLYADLIHASELSSRFGSASITRLSAGAELAPIAGWSVRTGVTFDSSHEFEWSAGVGYRFDNNAELQVAYQSNATPEINPEWGRSRLLSASLGMRF